MTDNNMDEFDNEDFGSEENSGSERGAKKKFANAWRTNPMFKLIIIMVVVGIAIAAALGVFSGGKDPDPSRLIKTPSLNEPPGGKTSQAFIDQNNLANAQRAEEALRRGTSALPTPVGPPADFTQSNTDPLVEFKADMDRLRNEIKQQQQANRQIQALPQQQRNTKNERDDDLAKAMQKQLQQLMESWVPRNMKLVAGTAPAEEADSKNTNNISANALQGQTITEVAEDKNVVQAGSVNYAQLLTEANSDVQTPILAQILSGPLAGGRAIGRFKVTEDYLIIEFNLVNHKGKDYSVNALALDPDTTLAGLATEVDHRYFARVILPAAGSFVSAFGRTMSQPPQSVTSTNTATTVTQGKQGLEDATYAGIGQAGDTISQFLKREGDRIKPLVRVAVGTPMGIFFLTPVKESGNVVKNQAIAIPPGYRPSEYGGTGYTGYNNMDMSGKNYGTPSYNQSQQYEQPATSYQQQPSMVITPFTGQTNIGTNYGR